MSPRMPTEIDRLVIRGLQENPLLEKEVCIFILLNQIGGFQRNLSFSYFIRLIQRRDKIIVVRIAAILGDPGAVSRVRRKGDGLQV